MICKTERKKENLLKKKNVCYTGFNRKEGALMKKLIAYANEYAKNSDWKDFALLKLCLFSAGLMIGVALPKKMRKPFAFAAMGIFIATYVPLMVKFLRLAAGNEKSV